jgi:hypothetical protein
LHQRSIYDFLDALVALGYLNRDGIKETSIYSNTRLSDTFLVKGTEKYIGGLIEMLDDRIYYPWGKIEDALHTGKP